MSHSDTVWDEAKLNRLRVLWAEGLSTAQIGVRMGISKNAVMGKAHRLHLPSRPSPIVRDGVRAKRKPRLYRRASTLPPLDALAPSVRPAISPPTAVPAIVAPREAGRIIPCCWPIGELRTAGFHYCDADSVRGYSYCAQHAAVAFVRVRRRSADNQAAS